MIYELTYGGYRLGTFPTEAEAVRRAGYTLTLLRKEADGQWRLARDANLLTRQD